MTQGRYSTYTQETGLEILELLMKGKSLVSICKVMNIAYSTVMLWLIENKEFSASYTRAREAQADYFAEEIVDISDNEALMPDSRKVKIEARKWYASKVSPKKYGDKQQIDHSGTLTLSQLVEQSYKVVEQSPIKQIESDKDK